MINVKEWRFQMRRIILFFLMISTGIWAGYTDDAYRLYKKGEYIQAFNLYRIAYQDEGSIKAAYNMAVMIEKQKVHDRNILNYRPAEAAKWYKRVADSVPDEKKLTPAYCDKEIYPYYLKTFKKLADWSRKGHLVKRSQEAATDYVQKASVLKQYCKKTKASKHSTAAQKKSYKEELADAYLQKCTAARIIPSRNRTGIDAYPCLYYKKFPEQMKKIMDFAQYVRLYRDPTANNKEDEIKKINKKARRAARPILSYLVHEKVIPCYRKAETPSALHRCYSDYLSDCQQLTFGPVISCMVPEQSKSEAAKEEVKHLTEKERQKAIREIKKMLQHGNICPVEILCP